MKSLQAKNRGQWRDWLKKNHSKEKEVWLVYYKKHTSKPSIDYVDSVEEAICFGWIDGLKKKIDDERYARKFTPRKAKSKWSLLNIEFAKQAIKGKKMTSMGLAVFEQRQEYDKKYLKARTAIGINLAPEIQQALKKEETKQRRLKEAIRLLEQNQTLGMK